MVSFVKHELNVTPGPRLVRPQVNWPWASVHPHGDEERDEEGGDVCLSRKLCTDVRGEQWVRSGEAGLSGLPR